MKIKSIKNIYQNLGPGMLFAAQSVGTSHLVQSTRAGGEYGFSLVLLVMLACIIKYPAFRFGIDYANATKTSLLEHYLTQGKLVIGLFTLSLLVDMFIAIAAVTLVSAGLLSAVLNLDVNAQYIGVLLLFTFGIILVLGGYKTLENITKLFVLIFVCLVLVATAMTILKLFSITTNLLPAVEFNNTTLFFMIAVAGWMPTSVSASVYLSEWRAKKIQLVNEETTNYSSIDFDIGYWGTAFLAFCFVLLGAVLIYPTGVSTEQSAIGFAKLLFSMFTNTVGEWAFPVIALAAIAVMISTCLTLMDACPRAAMRMINKFKPIKNCYSILVFIQIVGASIILLFFVSSFTSLIDLATGLAFISAPIIAFLNHRAVFHSTIEEAYQPKAYLKVWSIVGIIALSIFSIIFIYVRFLSN